MPVRPNLLERIALYRLNAAPPPLLDAFGAFSFRVMVAGLRLGVFDALAAPTDVAALSSQVGVGQEALTSLLEALAAIGYVEETPAGWVNTAAASRWLAQQDQPGVRNGVEYWARLLEGPLSELEETLAGAPGHHLYEWLAEDEETADLFQAWMIEVAGLAGSAMLRKVNVGDARTVLDVGGGHGWYAIELCRRNPGLSATIVDYPAATRQTGKRIDEAGLGDRVTVIKADYTTFEPAESFDIALMFNILHGHKSAEMEQVLARSRTWLSDGGRLVVLEQFPTGSGLGRTSAALLGLAYTQLLDGQAHSREAIQRALTRAGFSNVRRTDLRMAPGNSIIEATLG